MIWKLVYVRTSLHSVSWMYSFQIPGFIVIRVNEIVGYIIRVSVFQLTIAWNRVVVHGHIASGAFHDC